MSDKTSLRENEIIRIGIQKVRDALYGDSVFFDIEHSEIFNDDSDVFSSTIKITPKELDTDDGKVNGKSQYLQIDVSDGEYNLIAGEDTEISISFGNIYRLLYWSEVQAQGD